MRGPFSATNTLPRRQGFLLHQCHSPQDGAPISFVATGFLTPSANPKTGPMIQASVLRTDVPPHVAVRDGLDVSVCNACELRQHEVKRLAESLGLPPGEKPPMCYVTSSQGILQTWKSLKAGDYPPVWPGDVPRLFRRRRTRAGAYGNLTNLPEGVVVPVLEASASHTMYDHNWDQPWAQWARPFAMASVSSVARKEAANDLGWRTFRVKDPSEPVLPDEVVCPASDEAGKLTTCDRCLLCSGASLRAKNVVTDDHGPTSRLVAGKRHPLAMAKPSPERMSLRPCY